MGVNTAGSSSMKSEALRALSVVGLLLGIAGAAAQSANGDASLRSGYVGNSACVSCHRTQSLSYTATGHHLTSQLPTEKSVHGSFAQGVNTLVIVSPENKFGLPGLWFTMEARNGKFTETAFTGYRSKVEKQSAEIDIVTGSGKRGQTYLSWRGDSLFELPVSFWTAGSRWINSPGYADGTADFSRPVNPGCMECHSTYLEPLESGPNTNRYRKDTFVPGISCETCHGPGALHVASESAKKSRTTALEDSGILNPAHFSRDRQVDLCALCHNGIKREPLAPAFSYLPGRPLSAYFRPLNAPAVEHPDVHGNQVGLLQRSKCYLSSPSMSCSTCHDVHAREKSAASYSQKCMSCHRWESCGLAKTMGHKIAADCIDCHMPKEATTVIVSETAGKEMHATMRNHWIKVYPQAKLP